MWENSDTVLFNLCSLIVHLVVGVWENSETVLFKLGHYLAKTWTLISTIL